jgi:hypothetical protein
MASVKQSLEVYVEGTLIPGIRLLQCKGFEYLSFGLIGSSIELLGCFLDSYRLGEDKHSKTRFNSAIDELFVGIRSGYRRTCPCKGTAHDHDCL